MGELAGAEAEACCWLSPCAPFSTFMALSPDSVAYREKVAEGIRHLAFCMEVYAWQHAEGRLFLHEHPHGAWSWKEPYVVAVLELEGVMAVVGDQCMFGLVVGDRKGVGGIVRRLSRAHPFDWGPSQAD